MRPGPPQPSNSASITSTEETAKRLVRKATKLQQRQLVQLLAPILDGGASIGRARKKSDGGISALPPSASSSDGGLHERKTSTGELVRLCTNDGESLGLDCQWGTQLNQDDTDWVFQLFRRNMRQLYLKSQWGYDECLKLQELQATTARFLILRNPHSRPVAYAHFRFVEDDGRAVLYCFEIQVERDYQQKGAGTLLLELLKRLGKSTQMEALMCTVFVFNAPSLAFFHKVGFRADRTCMLGKDCVDECHTRDFVILSLCLTVEDSNEEQEQQGSDRAEGVQRLCQHKNAGATGDGEANGEQEREDKAAVEAGDGNGGKKKGKGRKKNGRI